MPHPRLLVLLAACLLPAAAQAQTTVVLFDEDDPVGEGYYDASRGSAEGGDALELAGPTHDRLPIEDGAAYSGTDSGRLAYTHAEGGAWRVLVGAPGFGELDLSAADSLALRLNAPAAVPGWELPALRLEDAAGRVTAALAVGPFGHLGYDAGRSGFLPGSPTDAVFTAYYLDALPPDLARPGYPEDLTFTFADVPLDTSTAAIGLPAVPANFRIDAASGLQLDFRFRDLDGDGTISLPDEYVDVLTPEPGTGTLRPTWHVALQSQSGAPDFPPGEGDVYLLAVDNAGLDDDPGTWQARGFAVADFGPLGLFDLARVRGVRFESGGATTAPRTLWFDYVVAREGVGGDGPPAPTDVTVTPGDETVVLRWSPVAGARYHVYRQADPEDPFERLTAQPVREPNFIDFTGANGTAYTYVVRSVTPQGVAGGDADPVEATPVAGGEDPFLDLLAELAFDYFWTEANPANGMVRDRSTAGSPASIAAVGFGLSAVTVGIDRGWISRAEGADRVLATLQHLRTCPQGPAASNVCGYRGFFYHFLGMSDGLRAGTTELSTIDTALLLGGVLHARQYFDGDGDEAAIRQLADEIYERVEWGWAANHSPLVTLAWSPEDGFSPYDWVGYNEAMIIYLLGLGSPTHPLPDGAWEAWTAGYDDQFGTFYGYTFLSFPPLFGHQYSHLWFDFDGISDAYMRARGLDYFENSRLATLAQRAYCIDNPGRFPNYGPDEWGLTASDDPFGYSAHGAPPAQNDNGTITPTAPGGSIAFAPVQARAALAAIYQQRNPQVWGPYGFRDAYNVEENWYGQAFLGIDQGPFVIMIHNLETRAVWDRFMANAAVQRGLERAGFIAFVATEPAPEAPDGPILEAVRPNPARGAAEVRYTLAAAGDVVLAVYDLLGRRLAVLADGAQAAGAHAAALDTHALPSGVYVVRLAAAAAVRTAKLTVLH